MPLYESFKPTFSVKTREYAGSLADDLAAAKKQLNEQYLMGLDLQEKTQSSMADAANLIHEEDRNNWNSINSEVNSRLQSIAERGDYENAIPELYTLSNRAAQKMKPLLMQKKAYDEHVAKLEDPKLNLPQTVKEMKLAEANAQFKGGTKFNPDGTIQNPFRGTQPVQHLDNIEEAQKALKVVTGNSDNRILSFDELGQTYKIQTESGIVEVDKVEVENAIKQGMYMNPSWQQSIDQDARGRSFSNIKNLTEEGAVEWANTASGPKAEQVRQLIASGMPAKEAILTIEYKETKGNIEKSILDYAGNAAYRNTRSSFSTSPSTDEQRRYQEEQEALRVARKTSTGQEDEGSSTLLGVTVTGKVSDWAKVGDQVFEKTQASQAELRDLQAKLNAAKLESTQGTPESKINAQAEVLKYEKLIQDQTRTSNYIKGVEKRLLEDAASKLYPGKNMQTLEREAKWRNLFSNFTAANPLQDDSGKVVSSAEIFKEAVDKQNYTILQPASGDLIGQATPTGKIKIGDHVFSKDGRGWQLIRALENPQSNEYKKVYDYAKTMSTEGLAIRSTAVPIVEAKTEKAIKTLLKYPAAYDMANNKTVNTEGFDWDKASGISYIPELDRLSVTVPNAEGTPTNILVDASETRVSELVGSMLSTDNNISMKALGYSMKSGDLKKYLTALDQSGKIITTIPGSIGKDGKEMRLLDPSGNPVGLKRVRDGSIVLVDSSGKIIRDMQTIQDAVSLFEISKQLQK
jgi:hypothetical protein